jgi:hypothetical protein
VYAQHSPIWLSILVYMYIRLTNWSKTSYQYYCISWSKWLGSSFTIIVTQVSYCRVFFGERTYICNMQRYTRYRSLTSQGVPVDEYEYDFISKKLQIRVRRKKETPGGACVTYHFRYPTSQTITSTTTTTERSLVGIVLV